MRQAKKNKKNMHNKVSETFYNTSFLKIAEIIQDFTRLAYFTFYDFFRGSFMLDQRRWGRERVKNSL